MLVHGAGSFGHPLARRFHLGERRLAAPARDRALRAIGKTVARLRSHVLASCTRAGLPVVDLPAPLFAARRGPAAGSIEELLRRGLVPVTGGDAVPDRRLGARVLGGDELLARLAALLRPRLVLHATDVDGLFLDGRLAARVRREDLGAALRTVARSPDATGGMRGKLEWARPVVRLGIPVRIVNGARPGRLRDALQGRDVPGTTLEAAGARATKGIG